MRFALFALVIVFAACAPASKSISVPSDLPVENLVLAPGETRTLRIPPDPNRGPSEENPQVLLEIQVVDEKGSAVTADSVSVDNQVMFQNVTHFELPLSGLPDHQTVVKINVKGFAPWAIGFRFNLKHSRHFALPAQMKHLSQSD